MKIYELICRWFGHKERQKMTFGVCERCGKILWEGYR